MEIEEDLGGEDPGPDVVWVTVLDMTILVGHIPHPVAAGAAVVAGAGAVVLVGVAAGAAVVAGAGAVVLAGAAALVAAEGED